MSRLTKKNINGYDLVEKGKVYSVCGMPLLKETVRKLGKLEDLEEELGCPLEVVFEAIEKGIEVIPYQDKYGDMTLWNTRKPLKLCDEFSSMNFEEPNLVLHEEWGFSQISGCYQCSVLLKDYQKTWWLKGENNETKKTN